MELIQTTVSNELKQALQEVNLSYFSNSTNNLINHRVFYCNKWSAEENKKGYYLIYGIT
jgi:hypothetical protein